MPTVLNNALQHEVYKRKAYEFRVSEELVENSACESRHVELIINNIVGLVGWCQVI